MKNFDRGHKLGKHKTDIGEVQVLGDEYDSEDNSLGSVVERFETPITVYLCSDDVVALIERLDGYAGDSGWNLVTLDRTNDGKFYAFLTRMGH